MSSTVIICDKRKNILDADGHLLIEGGPGSGKTTIALLKANRILERNFILSNQKVLFLSFARATISRVEDSAKAIISKIGKKQVEINTYHGFSWSLIQSYAYLLNQNRTFKLITPPHLHARISQIPNDKRETFKQSLFEEEGIICFDLFSKIACSILKNSNKICSLISNAYPFIIVDEFQDTDDKEWELIRLLGQKSTIIALADLDQRIFEFRGASVKRVPEFNEYFKPSRFDFGKENNRSTDTDIMQFGDDLLLGKNKGKEYQQVLVNRYKFLSDSKMHLRYAVLNSINRLKKLNSDGVWSIAILVKSKLDTLSVSSYLSTQNINHEVLIDPSGPSLAASIIARLLEPCSNNDKVTLISNLIRHIKGRKGDKLPAKDLELSVSLEKYLQTGKILGKTRIQLINEIKIIIELRKSIVYSGIPENDWLAIRKLFQNSKHEALKNVFQDARYLRLLNKGATLSERLSEMWRFNKNYDHAEIAIEAALTQEHFSMANRTWDGIFVMNIHKSKGKEFDEVIIWEEMYKQIVPFDADASRLQQSRLLLRVAATRAKSRTTFLTPAGSPCILM